MSTELTYLALTSLLAACMWLPYIIGVNMHPVDPAADFYRPPDLKQFPAWVYRSHRAHLNLLEQLVPMAVLLLIAHAQAISTPVTQWAVILFFWLRVAHAIGMTTGLTRFPFRPIIFTSAWVCILAVGWQVLLR